jgi:hypothetical protein
MKNAGRYLLFFVILFTYSCKKNPLPAPEPEEGSVFKVNCKVNGAPILLEAGINNYYLYASHFFDTSQVYVYKAELKQNNCQPNCGYEFTFLINDFRVSAANAAMKPDSGLIAGSYTYNDGNLPPLRYEGTFSALAASGSYTWAYSDGSSTKGQNASDKHFFKEGPATVRLSVANGTCATSHLNEFDVGNPLQASIAAARIEPPSVLNYSFSAVATLPDVSYFWEFGDGNSSNAFPSVSHQYGITEAYYRAKLSVTNGINSCVSYYQVPAFFNPVCQANFSSHFTAIPNPKALSAVTIMVFDPSTGLNYSSALLDQPATSQFEILSVENYKNNEQGLATRKMKVRFSCKAVNGSNTLNITHGEAIIAVSYL